MKKGKLHKRGGALYSPQRGWELGSKNGYGQGFNNGYHLGSCESVVRNVPAATYPHREVRVLYVTAGIGDPYPALDRAIIDALGRLVKNLAVANPGEDVAAMAEKMNADLVLALNGVVLPAEQVAAIRNKGIRAAVWFTDDPYYTDWTAAIAPRYDYVFTLELSCVSFYQNLGCANVHYLPFGVDRNVFHPRQVDASYRSDVCFIGTAYWNRVALIDHMSDFLASKNTVISGWWWDRLKNYSVLADKIRLGAWMSPEETSCFYSGAKIVINLHRAATDDSLNANGRKIPALSLNPRTFEISACGTLQLTDLRQDMNAYYEPETEIATYSSPEELMEKIDYYLAHEEERRKIAIKGLRRTIENHTYPGRLNQMMSIIFDGAMQLN